MNLINSKIRKVEIDGINEWVWPEEDEGAWEGPSESWPLFREAIIKNVDNFNICVQAGGNLGLYPRLLSQMFNFVFTYEPDFVNFEYLKINTEHAANVFAYNSALGETKGTLQLQSGPPDNFGMHKIVFENTFNTTTVPVTTIDIDHSTTGCDLIFLDIENYEYYALKGALLTIKQHKPVVIVENETTDIREFLIQLGYRTPTKITPHDSIFVHKDKLHLVASNM